LKRCQLAQHFIMLQKGTTSISVDSNTISRSIMMTDIEFEMRDIISDIIFDKSEINYEYETDLYIKNSDDVAEIIIKELKERGYNFTKEYWQSA